LLASFEPMHVNLIGSYSIMKTLYVVRTRNLYNHELAERSGVSTVMWWLRERVPWRRVHSRAEQRVALVSIAKLPTQICRGG